MGAALPDTPVLLDAFCPLHAVLDHEGEIKRTGPLFEKLYGPDCVGQPFLDVFELRRPRNLADGSALMRVSNSRLLVYPKDKPELRMKGALIASDRGGIVNLSFGLSIHDAVSHYNLTQADFAATDLAVEMLYLIEANQLAMTAALDVTRRLQAARTRAEHASYTDALTGLLNRRGLDAAIADLQKAPVDIAFVMLDLDHFKQVNDTLGHAAGDHVLRHVADILTAQTREHDIVARCGGDEFVLILLGPRDLQLGDRMTGLIRAISAPVPYNGNTCRIGASVGSCLVPAANLGHMEYVEKITDDALYRAKSEGRGCHIPVKFNP